MHGQAPSDTSNNRLLRQDLPGRGGGDRLMLLVDKDHISSQGSIESKSQDMRAWKVSPELGRLSEEIFSIPSLLLAPVLRVPIIWNCQGDNRWSQLIRFAHGRHIANGTILLGLGLLGVGGEGVSCCPRVLRIIQPHRALLLLSIMQIVPHDYFPRLRLFLEGKGKKLRVKGTRSPEPTRTQELKKPKNHHRRLFASPLAAE